MLLTPLGPIVSRRQIVLDEASVTATENILMAAVLAEGETILYNAACEPHVQDLAHLLNKMGAAITGIGTNRLIIHGVKTLSGRHIAYSPITLRSEVLLPLPLPREAH